MAWEKNSGTVLTQGGSRPRTESDRPGWPGWMTFARQWLRHPRRIASVAPSGRQLGKLMVASMPAGTEQVVELGAGTGAITRAILRAGIAPRQLLSIEINSALHRLLCARFPTVHVACGDARDLEAMVAHSNGLECGQVDAICSSLGLLVMPPDLQQAIIAAAFKVLRPAGQLIQYTYGRHPPLDEGVREALGLVCTYVGTAWFNLPPARVFVYSRAPAAATGSEPDPSH